MARPILEFDLERFGAEARRYRQSRRLSMAAAQRLSGVHKDRICRIENGDYFGQGVIGLAAWAQLDPRDFLKPKGDTNAE